MTWRNWRFIILLLLLNYIVFSILGSYVFVGATDVTPTATQQPTFTPGARVLTRVAPIQYPFVTPSGGSPTSSSGSPTPTSAATSTRAP